MSDESFYENAPVTVVGKDDESGLTTSLFSVLSDDNLNGVNLNVVSNLLNVINDKSVWADVNEDENGLTYLSAKNFGMYGDQSNWEIGQGNAQIVVKLFDGGSLDENASDIDKFLAQYWQLVYRSSSDFEDVITLYMCRPFVRNYFDNTTPSYGDYSNSDIRVFLNDIYKTLAGNEEENVEGIFQSLDDYVVAPYQLSSKTAEEIGIDKNSYLQDKNDFLNLGGWQSSAYQTDYSLSNVADSNGNTFLTGVSEAYKDAGYYAIMNGLDGISTQHTNWGESYVIESAYSDKLWLPSNFETIYTNSLKDGITSEVLYADGSYSLQYGDSGINADGRSGLWELNGYDRAWAKEGSDALTSRVWLRSGYSKNEKNALEIFSSGKYYSNSAVNNVGVRPAIHLNMKQLSKLIYANVYADVAETDASVVINMVKPERNWAENIPNFYLNMFEKNSTSSDGTASIEYSFDTSKYQIGSIEVNGQIIDFSNKFVGQIYELDNICNYYYQKNENQVIIYMNKLKTDVYLKANIVRNYTTNLSISFNDMQGLNYEVIVNVIKGSKDNYSSIQQIVIGREEETNPLTKTISLLLEAEQQYTIVVSKPYTWQVDYEGSGVVIGDCYVFTVTSQSSHTITITSGGIPNIWVSI